MRSLFAMRRELFSRRCSWGLRDMIENMNKGHTIKIFLVLFAAAMMFGAHEANAATQEYCICRYDTGAGGTIQVWDYLVPGKTLAASENNKTYAYFLATSGQDDSASISVGQSTCSSFVDEAENIKPTFKQGLVKDWSCRIYPCDSTQVPESGKNNPPQVSFCGGVLFTSDTQQFFNAYTASNPLTAIPGLNKKIEVGGPFGVAIRFTGSPTTFNCTGCETDFRFQTSDSGSNARFFVIENIERAGLHKITLTISDAQGSDALDIYFFAGGCEKNTTQEACEAIQGCAFLDNTCKVTATLSGEEQDALSKQQLQSLLESRYAVFGYSGPLPACAFSGTCNDVNDLLQFGINVGRWIFGLLGSFALVMFVYGGFVWVLSGGNPERVKKGRNIVVAAVVGLVIAFGAYILIGFLLDALSVEENFRAIQ